MRKHWLSFAVVGFITFTTSIAQSAEPYMKFLQGLRDRQYFDYAILYLEQIQADAGAPAEIKAVIPYERALTHLAISRTIGNLEAKNKELDLALSYLEEFVKKNARHELLGRANSQRAKILIERAKVQIFESRSPSNQESRAESQKRGRALIGQAKEIFAAALKQHEAERDKYPPFIDKLAEPDKFKAREEANVRVMQAELDLALCSYWDAQTFDVGSPEQKKRLTTASTEFEAIHTEHRTVVAGLYARMWQGKCFEEQDDIKRAIGIYNELLQHDDKQAALKGLQNHVRRYRLICLNHEKRHDYVLAIEEADTWLKANRVLQRAGVGLAIRWELARSRELLVASQREMKETDRNRTLQQALEDYRYVNRYPGEFKDLALFKTRELMVKLNKGEVDPTDFDTAFGLGRDLVKKIDPKKEAIAKAQSEKKPKEEIDKLKEDQRLHLKETDRILTLALDLADSKTEIKSLNEARYFLSYVKLLQGFRYESAILSEFVAIHYVKGDSAQTAQDAAYLALAAYVNAYNVAPREEKVLHLKWMERAGQRIVDQWPNSDRANDARLQLGGNFSDLNRPIDAAKWFGAVPVTSPKYSRAQLQAGQSFWAAYLNTFELPEEARPSKDELSKWQQTAEQHLRTGIDKTLKEIPATGNSPDLLIAGKVSLVQILITQGKYQEGIDLLTKDPHPVTKAIVVQDEKNRPKTGVKGVAFASAVYQFLLRCYVGIQNLEKARETMQSLEKVVAAQGGGGEAVTEVYKELGKELEKELKSLKAAGDSARLNEVRKSFESFLNDMFNRQDQTYSSLVWVAETYFGLGQGSEEEAQQADLYFEKAGKTYEAILDRIASGTIKDKDIGPARIVGAKMRLVTCKRHEGEFDKAVDLISEILADKPRALDAQMEAAMVYQSWGASGQTDSWKKYKDAIIGGKIGEKNATMWGWGNTSKRLHQLLFTADQETKDKYQSKFYEARYNASYCRQQLGLNESQSKKRKEILSGVKLEIVNFAAVAGDIDQDWWDRFDRLYRNVQKDLGETPVALEKRKSYVASTGTKQKKSSNKKKKVKKKVAAKDDGGSNLGMIIAAVVIFGGGGVGVFFMFKSMNKRPRVAYSATAPVVLTPKKQAAPSQARAVRAKQARAKQQQQKGSASGQSGKPKQPQRKPKPSE